ncbi:unnamed protein product [Rotaria magnacalcarata]|uniref:Uncharacterized protein n=1 Tax=Rotaria magnacalcarata TaxID=392030 RepID=A0A815J0Z5_9BILA|nr:unnamed protein product [Rotaria magnacalcarata]CAF2207859.1 unnamed protein product [Rotaria magnacalcarata]CAF4149878.1 unnamed protein product [Rotaria magnacalcarata]
MLIATLVLSTKTTTTTTTTTTITVTTAAKCVSPYVQASSGICVNVVIDINNCGKLNNVCPSDFISCSAGLCTSVNGFIDDQSFTVTVPFNITLYSTTTKSVSVTTNGVICLSSCSTAFTETALPASAFSGAAVLPFWNDLYVFANTSQGIYYDTQGIAPNRTLIFEYYSGQYRQSTDYCNFQITFYENVPGVVQFIYYDATDGGISATIGVQGSSSGPFIQYSFGQANSVAQNMVLTFDTNTGTYSSAGIG